MDSIVIPKLFLRHFTPNEALVFSVLCYLSRQNKVYKSYSYILKCLEGIISYRTLIRIIKKLHERQYIRKYNSNTEHLEIEIIFLNFNDEEVKQMAKTFIGIGKKTTDKMTQRDDNLSDKTVSRCQTKQCQGVRHIKNNNKEHYKEQKNSETSSEGLSPKILSLQTIRDIHKEKLKSIPLSSMGIRKFYTILYTTLKEKGYIIPADYTKKEIGMLKKTLMLLKQEDIHPTDYILYCIEKWEYLKTKMTWDGKKTRLQDFPNVFDICMCATDILSLMLQSENVFNKLEGVEYVNIKNK